MLYVTTRTELDYARQIIRRYNQLRGQHRILEEPEFSFMFKNIERAIRKYDRDKLTYHRPEKPEDHERKEFPTSEIDSD